jgi:glycosyltransferase involved in cell wall biosynthesis
LGSADLDIIVIDDGSTDDTAKVAASFPLVRYFFQVNQGLAAARNAGIERAMGEFVCLLDADDWFYPVALLNNLRILVQEEKAAFIYGCYNNVNQNGIISSHCFSYVEGHFAEMLKTNFIGNPSAVIYRKTILGKHPFDTDPSIRGCEDYDLYLSIMRQHPVLHNPLVVSAYRKHANNMSNNHVMMLNSALNVLLRHKQELKSQEEKQAWHEGWHNWQKYYGYFPLRNNNSYLPTRFHWELLRKYSYTFPAVALKKVGHSITSRFRPDRS